MSEYVIKGKTLQDIGDAIKGKMGTETVSITPVDDVIGDSLTMTVWNQATNLSEDKTQSLANLFPDLTPSYYMMKCTALNYPHNVNKNAVSAVNTQITVPADSVILSYSNHSGDLEVTYTIVPLDENQQPYLSDTATGYTWTSDTESYTSTDSIPVRRFASLISNLPTSEKPTYQTLTYTSIALSTTSTADVAQYGITQLKQIVAMGWYYDSYLYWSFPAREIDSSGYAKYYKQDPSTTKAATSPGYVYLASSKYLRTSKVTGFKSTCFIVYTDN